ncbi:hypothetical protein CRX50_00150 [Escherichia coli]|nr:hypothetical protein [Salmonella enterica]EBN6689441.1 hypothetical protein [Salmonella enterica]PHG89629.1 hypothetical protein CRX50_00150 [Escherichia coli]
MILFTTNKLIQINIMLTFSILFLREKTSFPYLLFGYQNYCIFKHRAVARLVKNFAYETIYLSL